MRSGTIVLTTLFGNQPEQPKLRSVDATDARQVTQRRDC